MPGQENNGVIDLSLGISKKRIRIDGDDNKIVLLNTSDFNVVPRMDEAYPKLQALFEEAERKEKESDSESEKEDKSPFSDFSEEFKTIDTKMKELIDYIFDSNVSEVCAGNSSVFSLYQGVPMFEVIISNFTQLYSDTLASEMKKTQNRIKSHTNKYKKK